jgi:coniferyl-aldehyde dehydrogenase
MPVVDRSNEAIQDNPAQLRVMREEIFGAILPVKPYDPLEEAIDFVNDGERPLVVYVFSKDERSLSRRCSRPPRVVRARPSSLSTAPCTRCRSAASATARSTATHGIEGFREFSNPRALSIRGENDLIDAFAAPYGEQTKSIVAMAFGQAARR